jgi:multidrug resistance efflux pump
VNPIFTWVRLAQRIPVRIHIDDVPKGVVLAAGITATVQINPMNPQLRTVPDAASALLGHGSPIMGEIVDDGI